MLDLLAGIPSSDRASLRDALTAHLHAIAAPGPRGVFGNPVPVIWESMLWALEAVRPLLHRDLCVVVNGYSLGHHVPPSLLEEAALARGGALVTFDRSSVSVGA